MLDGENAPKYISFNVNKESGVSTTTNESNAATVEWSSELNTLVYFNNSKCYAPGVTKVDSGFRLYDVNFKRKINFDFTMQGNGTVLCSFFGHTHGDLFISSKSIDGKNGYVINTDNNTIVSTSTYISTINEIAIDNALCWSSYNISAAKGKDNIKTSGTVNEIAFDVVSVDLIDKKVNCYRFGAGNNRACTLGGGMTIF